MKEFFYFWPQVDGSKVFHQFDSDHLLLMLCVAVAIHTGLRIVKKQTPEQAERTVKRAAVAVPVVEGIHTIWLYLCGQTNWVKLLPLHLCAMQSFFIPLAVFSKNKVLREFVYCTSILGGICAIVFPVGVAETYPMIHFQTIQTMVLHGLLIFVPLALIVSGQFMPDKKNYGKVVLVLLCAATVAAGVDFATGENYMFLNYAPLGTPLFLIFKLFGKRAYLGCTFLLGAAAVRLMYVPAERWKKRHGYAWQEKAQLYLH